LGRKHGSKSTILEHIDIKNYPNNLVLKNQEIKRPMLIILSWRFRI